jgi:chemotaxis protein MotB
MAKLPGRPPKDSATPRNGHIGKSHAMPKKQHASEPENHERWLVSYADFITLLFAFFVVMFASSQTDKARAKQVSEAVEKALNNGGSVSIPPAVAKVLGGTVDDKGQGNAMMKGPGGTERAAKEAPSEEVIELMPSLERLNKDLEKEIREGKLEIRLEPRGLVISLRQSAFFPSGEDAIDPSTLPAMKKMAQVIQALPNSIQLEGHTDSIPIHNLRFKSNWELSCARAIAVLETLCGTFQLPRERFSVVGRAETAPIDSNDTPEGRARNRRVDIVIMNALKVRPEASAQKLKRP